MHPFARGVIAGAAGGLVSGLPSTLHALLTGRHPLTATRAAGTLLAPSAAPPGRLLLLGLLAHSALSLGWGAILARLLPRRPPIAWGAGAGLLIALLDLGLIGRRLPAIHRLPQAPQVADHLLYGVAVAAVLRRLEGARRPG